MGNVIAYSEAKNKTFETGRWQIPFVEWVNGPSCNIPKKKKKPLETSISTWFVCHWHEFGIRDWRPLHWTHFRILCFAFICYLSFTLPCTSTDSLFVANIVLVFQLQIVAVNIILASFINSHQITVDWIPFALLTYHLSRSLLFSSLLVVCHEICIPIHDLICR